MTRNETLDKKLLNILKLCHMNFWEWDLKTKVLTIVNVADKETMGKISPLMAQEKAVIPNYPKVLIDKGIIKGNAIELVDEYEMMIYHAENGENVSFRIPFTNADGLNTWIQFKGTVYLDDEGKPDTASGYYSDITAQLDASSTSDLEKLFEIENRNNQYMNVIKGLTLEYANVFMVNLDDESYVPFRINDITNKMVRSALESQHSYKEVVSYYIQKFVIEEDRESMQCLVNPVQIKEMLRDKGYFNINYRSFREGEVVYCQAKVALGNVGDNEVVLAFRNIDEDARLRKSLEKESRQDSLTGLLNRKAFKNDILQVTYSNKALNAAFIFIDLDNFKNVNDTLGHAMGDKAIADTAEKLKRVFRRNDIIGRYGGDEFCIFIKDIPKDLLIQRLEYCLEELKETYKKGLKEISITASIGIAYYENYIKFDLARMSEQADDALYKAKKEGRNRFIIDEYKREQ